MFETALRHPANRLPLYGAAALVAAVELFAAWQSLHPHVPDTYRAYFIDRTTTCLDQPVAGTYAFGSEISFSNGGSLIKPLRVCGWEGPVGNGLHAVGESSRLRFALPTDAHGLTLMVELSAIDAATAGMPVTLVANGTELGTIKVMPGDPQRFTLPIPDAAVLGGHPLELEFRYPEAMLMDPHDSNVRKRSVKLSAGSITGAGTRYFSNAGTALS